MAFQKLERLLDSFLTLGIPGVDCMVYQGGKPVFRHSAGFADQEQKRPVAEDTLWYIYSMTKVVTCTAGLLLYEEGKFLLDDPLFLYLPEFEHMTVKQPDGSSRPAERPILLQDLFGMSAGFSYNMDTETLREGIEATGGQAPTREMMKYLAKDPLLYEPGTQWAYSLCHDVLGALIEVLSGQTLGQFMKERIFDPLGMKDTAFRLKEEQEMKVGRETRLAAVYDYDWEKKESRPAPPLSRGLGPAYESGGAGLISSTADYARFADALTRGKLLHPNTLNLMRTNRLNETQLSLFRKSREPGIRKSNERAGYGYGLGVRTMIDPVQGGSNGPLGEFGWGGALGGYVLMDPDRELSLTYFQHTLRPPAEYTRSRLRNVLYSCLDAEKEK